METRICYICKEKTPLKWVRVPNRFFSDLPEGNFICQKHYRNEHSKQRYQNKIKGNIEYNEKRRIKSRERYKRDPVYREKCLKKVSKEGASNYAKIVAGKKRYAGSDKGLETGRIRNRRYYYKHSEKIKEKQKKLSFLISRQYSVTRSVAKRRDIPFLLSFDEFTDLRISNICHYCLKLLPETGSCLDRRDSAGPYSLENCVPCCKYCNATKSNILTEQEMLLFCAIKRVEKPVPMCPKFPLPPVKTAKTTHSHKKRYGRLLHMCKHKNIFIDLPFMEYARIIQSSCHYCSAPLSKTGYGIDKIISGKEPGYVVSNVVPACPPCNRVKNEHNSYADMLIINKVVSFYRRSMIDCR